MLYDIRLKLEYAYDAPVSGGRHLARVFPANLPGIQRVVAAGLTLLPQPSEQTEFTDFFGTRVASLTYRSQHDALEIAVAARVEVLRKSPGIDFSPSPEKLGDELAATWDMSALSPHHFVAASPRVDLAPAITEYARENIGKAVTVHQLANDLCLRIHADFAYDGEATLVDTPVSEAFALKRGVCQDFAHIMIAGLRGLGVPAGYVSGFLRTMPPEGEQRLEGADAMHAWVKVWCGREMGWIEFDPTNAMRAGQDHIVIGYGRDYSDVAPIVGMLRSAGGQETTQAVDVLEVA
ncbi:transglutaminase family protein [Pelagibacterium luteolum]|uniref:Transglutaminase-like enzyme, putative cysteine protease n=1 Tax=Pelagibacterium luteolum TaxID=440168 RepID=A0A1G7UY86_9HYPH|nr:transglutaminase family protein [Pelagibacterium luteolum]SDG52466.1 Transglutaminase-like enzyme, putative cysteine protease [Pelagibacterium luteolum]